MPDRKMVNYSIYSQKVENACKEFLKEFPVKGPMNPNYKHLRCPRLQKKQKIHDKKLKIKQVSAKHQVSEKLLLKIFLG